MTKDLSTEYVFEKAETSGISNLFWNPKTRRFLGRNASEWAKLGLFYTVFYFCLASFFIGMFSVFIAVTPMDKPRYFANESVMNAVPLNPGLGFRPQPDIEDSLIKFNPLIEDKEGTTRVGFYRHARNLKVFLQQKYECDSSTDCGFDYKKIFENTTCTEDKNFGYETNTPCVLVKLNRIVSWNPQLDEGVNDIKVRCTGEDSADKDNVKSVTYHSEGSIGSLTEGLLNKRHFPFDAQKNYKSPFIWVQVDVQPNTLVNIECKAYAKNIDNQDRMNRRGMTKFALYISNKETKKSN